MWEDILKRTFGRMTDSSRRLLDEVIDETPRSINEILDLMYYKLKERRKKKPGSGRDSIPTRGELYKYLSDNYNSIRVSKKTGKEVSSRTNAETRYFR